MILREVQLQETGERFKMFVMIYSGLVSVFSGFHISVYALKSSYRNWHEMQKRNHYVSPIHYFHIDHNALCLPPEILHKKITSTEQNNGFTPV